MKAKELAALLLETPELEVTFYNPFTDTQQVVIGVCDTTDGTVELNHRSLGDEED